MGLKRTDEFRQDAVRIALTSGLTRKQVEGRQATLVRVGEVTLSPLVFDLEHDHAERIQLVQTSERDFEVRIQLADEAAAALVFKEVIGSVKQVFRDNGLDDVTVRESEALPEITASGKFHEVVSLRSADARNLT